MACCKDCGWSEIIGSPIICHYTGCRTFRDECCEAWKPKEEEKPDMVEVVRCKDCRFAHLTYDGMCKQCEQIKDDDDVMLTVYFPVNHYCAYGERKE